MKKLLSYIVVFIVITALMLLFVTKNFSGNIVEINLKNIANPEQVNMAMDKAMAYDYINIYDIFTSEENSSVYTGNINIFLRTKDEEERGISLNNNEVIMGEKFMKKHYNYNTLGVKHITPSKEYEVNCIIKGSERIYYRDLSLLQTNAIKNQRIYLSLLSNNGRHMGVNNTIENLRYYGIDTSKYIYYLDVVNFFKKILILLVIIALSSIFFVNFHSTKLSYKQISEQFKSSKYDLELREFINNSDNFGFIIRLTIKIILQILIAVTILYLFIRFLNIKLSYSVDFTSLRSILDAVNNFVQLIKYYIAYGFTDISITIVKCVVVYLIAFVVGITINVINIIKSTKFKRQN